MKNRMVTKCMRTCLSLVALFAACGASVADVTYWKGDSEAYLNDADNWDGTAPFFGTSTNDMGFKNTPKEYTVKLSGDLVCAGTWKFKDDYSATTWDLCGYTMTFLTGYASNEHRGRTNIVMNGTMAFTNANGVVQTVNFNSARAGAAIFLRQGATFIGNVSFSDDAMKTLEVTDGAYMKGSISISGTAARGLISGSDTVVDLLADACNVGDEGVNSKMEILDGASVTNGTSLRVGATSRCRGSSGELIVSNATVQLIGSGKDGLSIGKSKDSNASHQNIVKFIDGANVDLSDNFARVGSWVGCSNLLYVAGEQTTFKSYQNSDNPFTVGQNGSWNEFHLTDGATMHGGYITAGGQLKSENTGSGSTSLWNRVTIDKGAKLNSQGELRLGWRHCDAIGSGTAAKSLYASNTIEIASAAQVTAAKGLTIGAIPNAFDNKLIVKDEGSLLTLGESGSNVTIGFDGGSGNGIEINGGASFSGLAKLLIGNEIHYRGDEELQATGSNNYFKVENTTIEASGVTYLGYFNNGGNCLYVGDGAKMKVKGVLMYGFGQEIVVSNGVLTTTSDTGLQTAYKTGNYTEADSGQHKFSFYEQGRIVLDSTNTRYGTFTNACVLAFHVPESGYTSAALESQGAPLKFSDDTEFVFDFSSVSKDGVKNVPLVAYTGSNAEGNRIVMSDELVAKANAAAVKARSGSKVKLSADGTSLTLRVGSAGLSIIVR